MLGTTPSNGLTISYDLPPSLYRIEMSSLPDPNRITSRIFFGSFDQGVSRLKPKCKARLSKVCT